MSWLVTPPHFSSVSIFCSHYHRILNWNSEHAVSESLTNKHTNFFFRQSSAALCVKGNIVYSMPQLYRLNGYFVLSMKMHWGEIKACCCEEEEMKVALWKSLAASRAGKWRTTQSLDSTKQWVIPTKTEHNGSKGSDRDRSACQIYINIFTSLISNQRN